MKKAGFDDRTIMKISGHKTAKSLENYDPSNSVQRKTEMATALLGAPEEKNLPAEPKERRVLVPTNHHNTFNGFGTQVVKPTEDTSMEDTTDEEELRSVHFEILSQHEVSGVATLDDSMNDSRQDGFQGPLTQVATTSAVPPQMVGSPNWPQFAANQSQANYNMSLFMGQMFGQMSRMSDHVMDMNSKLLAQNNALVKKLLQDDTKKQDNDAKKEDDSRLDGYDGPLTQQN